MYNSLNYCEIDMSDNIQMIDEMIEQMKSINQAIKVLKEENEKLKKEVKQLKWRLHEQD